VNPHSFTAPFPKWDDETWLFCFQEGMEYNQEWQDDVVWAPLTRLKTLHVLCIAVNIFVHNIPTLPEMYTFNKDEIVCLLECVLSISRNLCGLLPLPLFSNCPHFLYLMVMNAV
jgi:hypothetical protein